MMHRDPQLIPPLFAGLGNGSKNDAAPLAGGAGVNGPNDPQNLTQLTLMPPAHHRAPAGTSTVAAHRIAGHAKDLRARVLAFIIEQGPHGATDDEGEAALGIKPQTYTPRRGELVSLNLVADSGRRRKTASGRAAAVWVTPNHARHAPPAAQAPQQEGGAA